MAPPIEQRIFKGINVPVDLRQEAESTTPFKLKLGDKHPIIIETDWDTMRRLRDLLVRHVW